MKYGFCIVIVFTILFIVVSLCERRNLQDNYSAAIQSLKEGEYDECLSYLNTIAEKPVDLKNYKNAWTVYCQAYREKTFEYALKLEKAGDYVGALKSLKNIEELDGVEKEVISRLRLKQNELQDKIAITFMKEYENCTSNENKKKLIKKYLVKGGSKE